MLSFSPSPKLEKALKAAQSAIGMIGAELAGVSGQEEIWLQRWTMISTIGASTRIENAILTDGEIEGSLIATN